MHILVPKLYTERPAINPFSFCLRVEGNILVEIPNAQRTRTSLRIRLRLSPPHTKDVLG
jgi:hypothetical protein